MLLKIELNNYSRMKVKCHLRRDCMKDVKLLPPCSYQGGKQRLAKKIVDIIFEQNEINEETKFYDLCCGSGAITLELVNRGINPHNITMVDSGGYGIFWQSVANNKFNLNIFKNELDKLPSVEGIQSYLQELSKRVVDYDLVEYHYLLLQSGSFGSKQIWMDEERWVNCSFRSYWLPTETSNRKSPVNPMMPMPSTLYARTADIVNSLGGRVRAIHGSVEDMGFHFDENTIVYIDPPYKGTAGYENNFDYETFVLNNFNYAKIYVSEGYQMNSTSNTILLSEGREKGNINGKVKKKPVEEWLNIF